MKSLEFFKATLPYFESNLLPQKGGVNLHKLYLWAKTFFLEVRIFLITMKFPFQQYNIIDIIANGLKPVNDESKHD